MITAFHFYRRWFREVEAIADPIAYESAMIDYSDSMIAFALDNGIDPGEFCALVESE